MYDRSDSRAADLASAAVALDSSTIVATACPSPDRAAGITLRWRSVVRWESVLLLSVERASGVAEKFDSVSTFESAADAFSTSSTDACHVPSAPSNVSAAGSLGNRSVSPVIDDSAR